MFNAIVLLVLTIQFHEIFSWNSSNCSLIFRIQTNNRLTEFPIELQANYTFTCSLANSTIYYVIIPLTTLSIKQWNSVNEDEKLIIPITTIQWKFFINESSTIRLCVRRLDVEQNNRLCRQIHIGISELHEFWHLSMEIFYICTLSFVSSYYLFYRFIYIQCNTPRKVKRIPAAHRYQRTDTFENEKVHCDMSDEE